MENKKRNLLGTIFTIATLIIAIVVLWQVFGNTQREVITYYDFLDELQEDKLYSVYYEGSCLIKAVRKDSENYQTNILQNAPINTAVYYDITAIAPSRLQFQTDVADIMNRLDLSVDITYSDLDAGSWKELIIPGLTVVAIVALLFFLFKYIGKQNNQNMMFGKSKARVIQNVKVRFADVAGAEEEKEELVEIIDFLRNPKRYTEMGARIPHGILLVGPPGTGKTLFAKAVAGEAGVPFFSITGSDFVEMYVGVGASRVRDMFETAKRNTPCIVFIDEIDAVGRQRGAGLGGGNDEREQTLNQLLVEMDGFETNTGIIIMAATNRSDVLDPALIRPGRFDRQIYVNMPDVRGREAILKVHARNKHLGPGTDFKTIARITAGFSGADLENLLNEAAILATRARRNFITMNDITEGINKIIMGPSKKSRLVTEPDKRITAYHEAGHAILAETLKYCDSVQEVTIIPRGQAAGYTLTRPDNDNSQITRAKLLDTITMSLGGRVAEELTSKNISSGASSDIKHVTKLAHQMVTEWGMSERLGPLFYGSEGEIFVGKNYQTQHSYSEEMSAIIDEEKRKIIDDCHKLATKILTEKMDALQTMARILLEKETIYHEEVDMIVNGESYEKIIEYINKKEEEFEKKSKKEKEDNDNANTVLPV
ncbi:MAG: ATP-dependent zinc metalloprotease FtsH [Clostridia bacterium]|nr:ATP-dependent zinc metalloprotease FtsH [Clostridia bacterium]